MHSSLRGQPALRKLWLAAQSREDLSAATRKLHFLQSLKCTAKYERQARTGGAVYVAGVDEVGRGALFGPVVAGAVILPDGFRLSGLRDSKQLQPEERQHMAVIIRKKAIAWAVAEVDCETIDRVNIYQATKLAMQAAVGQLQIAPQHLLVDALKLPLDIPQTCLFYGDSLSISIAAASVVAKVHRDSLVSGLHEEFPQYNLRSNKGYATPDHRRALKEHGPCKLHRKTFAPVYLSGLRDQLDLLDDAGEPYAQEMPGRCPGEAAFGEAGATAS